MKETIKNFIVLALVWTCIIWACAFDPSNIWGWFKIAICLVSATVFFWWIFDFDNPFVEDEKERDELHN